VPGELYLGLPYNPKEKLATKKSVMVRSYLSLTSRRRMGGEIVLLVVVVL